MSVSKFRLTPMGWLGAALFVLPTPFAIWQSGQVADPGTAAFQRRLDALGGTASLQLSPLLITLVATASLIGMVMLLLGREIVTED